MEFDFDIMDIIDNEEYEEVITPNRPYLKEYGRGLKRRNDWKKAKRKENIVKHIYLYSDDAIRPRHWYSKNKVHCSCPLCSEKRKNGYIPIYELKMIDKMNDMMIEMSFIEENE